MIDFCYKLVRRSMPGFVYQTIRSSRFGRRRYSETVEVYRNIFVEYEKILGAAGGDFTGKTVLEVGCGDQIYTALSFLAGGCREVILVEPKLQIFNDKERVKRAIAVFKAAVPSFSLSEDEILARLVWRHDLREVSDAYNGKVDIVLTHTVLEHFSDLDVFYSVVHRLLAANGISTNVVDLSDHIWHIFRRFKALRALSYRNGLNHLRYSNKTFALINDPKCFMNRLLLPQYRQKAVDYGFDCEIPRKVVFDGKARIHKDVLSGLGVSGADDEKDLKVTWFSMLLRKRKG
jgi:SAM-dependent methyltransferase